MTGPSRDRAIERLLAVPAGRPPQDGAGPCVDAETVAAWLDGGAMGAAAERFEAHVAACASCQELLATVVRMTPVEAPVVGAVPRRPWTAWALPLAAAAVLVLVVWTTWPGSSRSAAPSELKEESRMARAEPPAAVPESAGPSAAPSVVPAPPGPSAPTATQAARRSGTNSPPTVADRAKSRPFAVAPAPPVPSAERSEREATPGVPPARQSATAEDGAADKSVVQAPSAPPPPPPVAETVAPRADAPAPATLPRADAPAPAAAGEARARRAGDVASLAAASQALRDVAAARVTVQAPGAMWRWRASRVLEYSSDGGATWRPSAGATSAQAADILAGSSPMPPAAWVVGRRGLVLVTVDGVRFEVRTPPAMVDLVVVQASDRQIAVVRSAAGGAWRTADGGRTWVAVAPGR